MPFNVGPVELLMVLAFIIVVGLVIGLVVRAVSR